MSVRDRERCSSQMILKLEQENNDIYITQGEEEPDGVGEITPTGDRLPW